MDVVVQQAVQLQLTQSCAAAERGAGGGRGAGAGGGAAAARAFTDWRCVYVWGEAGGEKVGRWCWHPLAETGKCMGTEPAHCTLHAGGTSTAHLSTSCRWSSVLMLAAPGHRVCGVYCGGADRWRPRKARTVGVAPADG